MTDTLVLKVAADSWNGDPQFTVSVDGKQVGGTFTTSASHQQGQWQDITLTGEFGTNPSAIKVSFLNDGYGGWGQDRNLYVGSLTLNGKTLAGSAAANPVGQTIAGAAALYSQGAITFNTSGLVTPSAGTAGNATTASSATTGGTAKSSTGSANNTLVLKVAADSWQGDPQFTVTVDGKQVGATLTTSASHAAGQWQEITLKGDFGSNPASVKVSFLNDGYGGWGQDRNLYVGSLTLNGKTLAGSAATNPVGKAIDGAAALYSQGAITFNTSGLTPATGTATPGVTTPTVGTTTPAAGTTTVPVSSGGTTSVPDPSTGAAQNTLVLKVAADSWQGDPQFSVTVDGKQVGATLTTSASHAAGQWQEITLKGDFGSNPASVKVSFLNDGYGGWGQDRNLYVGSLTLNGKTLAGSAAVNPVGNAVDGAAALFSQGTITFNTSGLTTTPATPATGAGQTASSPQTGAGAGHTSSGLELLGINLAGAEFGSGHVPGTYGTDYTYPTRQEVDYYADKGMDVIRVPFLWERMQNTLNGPLNADELARLTSIVDYATDKGLKVVIDPHDYGAGFGNLIGSSGTPNSAFADFWGKLGGAFSSNKNVIFGLMNEPNQQSASSWLGSANAAIAAIRGANADQEILVPGSHWDGAWTWTSSDNASVVGTGVKDPKNNYAFEVHQYLDPDGSGTKAGVAYEDIGVDRLKSVTEWAEANHAKLFLGEFGVSSDKPSLNALDKMLDYMDDHTDAWQGGTYWAGGPWWWGSNIYGAEPTGLGTSSVTDQPQMAVLSQHLDGTST